MKANKRIRDLRRRNKTGIRRYVPSANQFVTTSIWKRDAKGRRVENTAVVALEPEEKHPRMKK